MKIMTIAVLLLAAIVGQGQDLKTGTTSFYIRDTTPLYDTVKVIAEVYKLPEKTSVGDIADYDTVCHCFKNVRPDSIWATDSTLVFTHKVLAWEVWRRDNTGIRIWGVAPADMIKRFAYNRKDELTNVLQTWRVEW